MNDVRNRNIVIGILLVIILVGGYMVVNNTDALDGVFNNDTVEETEAELVCVNEGDLFDEVCAETERDAVLVALGRTPSTDTEVTVTFEGLTTSGMSSVILERYVVEEVVSTPVPSVDTEEEIDDVEEENTVSDNRNVITVGEDFPMFIGFPNSATPAYGVWNREQVNRFIPNAGYMLANPGVIGTHELDEANRNDSAVLITSNQRRFETSPARFALPESGYTMISTAGGHFVIGEYELDLPAIEFHEYIIVLRGNYEGVNNDRNTSIVISDFNPEFTLATAYDVPAHAGGFMSDEYVFQNVLNSFDSNCGLGDCEWDTLITIDVNSGAYTMQDYAPNSGWELISTNVAERYR